MAEQKLKQQQQWCIWRTSGGVEHCNGRRVVMDNTVTISGGNGGEKCSEKAPRLGIWEYKSLSAGRVFQNLLLDREAVSAAMRAHFVFGTFQTAARYVAETCGRVGTCAVRIKDVLGVN